jgi:hypothetical protein
MLEQLVEALMPLLREHGATEPVTKAVGWIKASDVLLGARYLAENTAPPRIVLVPSTERLEQPSQPKASDGVRIAKKRRSTIDAHLWGKDFTECELLFEALVQAVDGLTENGATYEVGAWATKETAAWLTYGELLIVPFTVPTRVIARQPTLATIREVTETTRYAT